MTIAHARRFTVVALASTIGAALLTMGPPALAVGACPAGSNAVVGSNPLICEVQFGSSTTWTVPAGVTSVDVVVVGGGGGGNGAAAGLSAGGGGGGGGVTFDDTVVVVPGTSVQVTVGSGGVGGSSSSRAGAAGGSSSFNGDDTASGGAAGSVPSPSDGNRSGGTPDNGGGITGSTYLGGGGGGAGGVGGIGTFPTVGGTGGNGTTKALGLFTGVMTKYGGGGGGGSARPDGIQGPGTDGGGAGGARTNGFGEPGVRGGGGGGASDGGSGGQGGMGVVIVRFLAPPVPPAAPTSLVATPQDGAASIAFTPGASGTSPISNYQYTLDDSTWIALVPDDTTSPVTIPTLTNGTTYSVKLRAVSLAGNGTASSAVSVTAGVVPAAPTGLEASAGNATATIAFTAGAQGTLPIDNYSYSIDGGTTWIALSPAVTTSPVTLTGLTNGTTYSVQLRAVSAVGPGAASTAVSVTPVAPPTPQPGPAPVFPPSAPASVTGMAGDGSAVLSWAAPASSGSFPVTSYQAVVSPGEQTCLVSAPALTCTISGLRNGTPYTATVRALNGAGWGPYAAASATFTPQPPVTPSITITGTRADVRGKPGVVVTGTTTGFDMGAILRPWIRFPEQTSYTQGTASILVDVQGGFTWERRTGKTIYISIRSEDGTVESNRLVVRTT